MKQHKNDKDLESMKVIVLCIGFMMILLSLIWASLNGNYPMFNVFVGIVGGTLCGKCMD
jgi:hypothetical protein